MQDFVYHQFVKKKKFDGWKTPWKAVVRDFVPYWVYQQSEKILKLKDIFESQKSKGSEETNQHINNLNLTQSSRFIGSELENRTLLSKDDELNRDQIVEKELDPLIKHSFEKEIKKTSKVENLILIFLYQNFLN